jgi:hypothetical protein
MRIGFDSSPGNFFLPDPLGMTCARPPPSGRLLPLQVNGAWAAAMIHDSHTTRGRPWVPRVEGRSGINNC